MCFLILPWNNLFLEKAKFSRVLNCVIRWPGICSLIPQVGLESSSLYEARFGPHARARSLWKLSTKTTTTSRYEWDLGDDLTLVTDSMPRLESGSANAFWQKSLTPSSSSSLLSPLIGQNLNERLALSNILLSSSTRSWDLLGIVCRCIGGSKGAGIPVARGRSPPLASWISFLTLASKLLLASFASISRVLIDPLIPAISSPCFFKRLVLPSTATMTPSSCSLVATLARFLLKASSIHSYICSSDVIFLLFWAWDDMTTSGSESESDPESKVIFLARMGEAPLFSENRGSDWFIYSCPLSLFLFITRYLESFPPRFEIGSYIAPEVLVTYSRNLFLFFS